MLYCIIIIIFYNHEDILFIAILNTNLIKQRNQCKIFYNLSNYGSDECEDEKEKGVISIT